jgi:very-short-patch-repair endonuclease
MKTAKKRCPSLIRSIRTVIELDDRSHERDVRKGRDSFLDAVLARAGIPIVRIAAAATYNEEELRNKLVSMKDQVPRKEG